MALPQAIGIRISMLRLAPQCFAFTSISIYLSIYLSSDLGHGCKMDKMAALCVAIAFDSNTRRG